jgi:glucosyl-dolichyl phosphate glucuronosyltransferase
MLTSAAKALPGGQRPCSGRGVSLNAERLDATVLICSYNRASFLGETLDGLARNRTTCVRWNVIVVDNNSSDGTREVVTSRIARYPVELQYLFEPCQGKSHALNTGLAATAADIIVFTDDDVRVTEHWVESSCRAMLDDPSIDYTGGPVRPIWERPCPAWLDQERADLWGTLAILDYGPEPFVFEERQRVPLGANMAVRRALIDRVGGFDPELGRKGDSLLGQEQAEFFCRSRAAGARGRYEPAMELHHHVPAARLTKEYFRRWWYWKGVAKSRLERRHPITELGVDLRQVPTVAGVPRFLMGSALRDAAVCMGALLSRNAVEQMRREARLCYFAGYLKGARSAETAQLTRATPTNGKSVPSASATHSLHL